MPLPILTPFVPCSHGDGKLRAVFKLTPESGCMADGLEDAIAGALKLDRAKCLAQGHSYTWEASTDQFVAALTSVNDGAVLAA